jgi:hypothetical protein
MEQIAVRIDRDTETEPLGMGDGSGEIRVEGRFTP